MGFKSKVGPAKIPVARHASNYSNEEIVHLQEAYASRKELSTSRSNLRGSIVTIALIVFCGGTLMLVWLPIFIPSLSQYSLLKLVLWSTGITMVVGLGIRTIPLICPACSNAVPAWDTFDRYCPECGGIDSLELREMKRQGWGFTLSKEELLCVYYTDCNQYLYNQNSNEMQDSHYVNYHVCTHCGLRLEKEGESNSGRRSIQG